MIRKPILIASATLALVAFLWACTCSSGGPKASARRFLVALKTHDFETAKCMVTHESYNALTMQIDQISQNAPGKASDIEIISVEKGDLRAMITYTDKGEEKNLELKKECGDWKPVFRKEYTVPDSIKSMFEGLPPPPPMDEDTDDEK